MVGLVSARAAAILVRTQSSCCAWPAPGRPAVAAALPGRIAFWKDARQALGQLTQEVRVLVVGGCWHAVVLAQIVDFSSTDKDELCFFTAVFAVAIAP
jgi:hypothetical protein